MASVAAPASAPPTPPAILLATVDAAVLDPMTAAVVAAAATAFDAAAATLATIAEIAIPKIPPCTEFRILSRPRIWDCITLSSATLFNMSRNEFQGSIGKYTRHM